MPGQFVVMDNASFHKSQKTKELIESVGCIVKQVELAQQKESLNNLIKLIKLSNFILNPSLHISQEFLYRI